MALGVAHVLFPGELERDEVVHRRLGEQRVLLHARRDIVPLRLLAVVERAAVAQPVKEHDREEEDRGIAGDARGAACGRERLVRQARQREQPLRGGGAEGDVERQAEQQQRAVVLVEEDIGEILLVRVEAEADRGIERIAEMLVEDHLPEEREVEDEEIGGGQHGAHGVRERPERGHERGGQARADEQREEEVRVEIHAPPESVAEAGGELCRRVTVRPIAHEEERAEDRAGERREQHQQEVRLRAGEKIGKIHAVSSPY